MLQKIFGTSDSKVTTTNDIENCGAAVRNCGVAKRKSLFTVEDEDHGPYFGFSIYLLL